MQIDLEIQEEKIKKNIINEKLSAKNKKWEEKRFNYETQSFFIKKLNLNPIIAKILVNRQITEKNLNKFIDPTIKEIMPDPQLIDDMKKATNKIVDFILKKKKIGIFGDYDVDGSVSTAIFCNYLKEIGVDYEFYIPDRVKEGYGPNFIAFDYLKKKKCDLIITLDCGTTSFKEIQYIKNKNIDVIVVDHHKEGESLPNAFAIVNPNKKLDNSNLTNLCAAGVVFFLLVSINRDLKKIKNLEFALPNLLKYLDLVALGTVCDLVKLDLINRALVKQGLKVFNQTNNLGLSSLINESNIKESINCFHLGYVIGPRINAGGRVGKSSLGTEILLSSNQKETDIIAKKLGEFNNLRKKIESQVETQACTMVNENNIICVNSNNWHPGVIGIVASKLTEKYNKPSIVISEDSKICTASCRSIPGFDIGQLIHEAVKNNVIEAGGGHKMAAGFKIQIKKIPELKNFIKAKCNIIKISNRNFYDDEVKLSSIDKSLCDEVEKLSPFGQGNSTPKFLIKDCIIKFCRVVGDNHLSCTVEDIYGNRFKAISFNALKNSVYKYIQEKMSGMFDLIVILKKNNWRGKETVELQIEDVI